MEQPGLGHLDPATPEGQLSVAEKQLAESARAFTRGVKILALDLFGLMGAAAPSSAIAPWRCASTVRRR